ncbi:MAG: tetraacyldisaccharide 4'-kinase [Marinilabiliaceae bacterium]|nr:tetraacyldisaccharide 4'-kinase [Marinilabiliaceae bacterium]
MEREWWRFFLLPLSWLYGLVVGLVNKAYDYNILKSQKSTVYSICVGNLTVGGTGKTPMIERLIEDNVVVGGKKWALLSRGYNRKTKGLIVVDDNSTVEEIGDEPMQMHRKYPFLPIIIDGDRNRAFRYISDNMPDIECVLMDDGMQHRTTRADKYILMCDYSRPIYNNFLLPAGNLRESWSGRKRASVIVINKCPKDISESERSTIASKMKLNEHQKLYFSAIEYGDVVGAMSGQVLAIAGVGRPQPFFDEVRRRYGINIECIQYPDHHNFTESDLSDLKARLDKLGNDSTLLCTEKDFQRLGSIEGHVIAYMPIRLRFLEESDKNINIAIS